MSAAADGLSDLKQLVLRAAAEHLRAALRNNDLSIALGAVGEVPRGVAEMSFATGFWAGLAQSLIDAADALKQGGRS